MKRYSLRLTKEAEADLERLYDFLLDRDPSWALSAEEAIANSFEFLKLSPFSCRRTKGGHARLRELIIDFGHSGYVALFEIDDAQTVTVLAVRHQREEDYH